MRCFPLADSGLEALSRSLEDKRGVDGRASTYFEYDPYPSRSQSYTVFRVLDAAQTERPEGTQRDLWLIKVLSFRDFHSCSTHLGEAPLEG